MDTKQLSVKFLRKPFGHSFLAALFTAVLSFNSIVPTALADTVQKARDCNAGGAAEQFGCFKEQLQALEKEMDGLIKQTVASYASMWGKEAVAEGQKRILEAQENWLQYRNKHCHFGYYSMAPAHPASQSARNTVCELGKTKERITEIKEDYLNLKPEEKR